MPALTLSWYNSSRMKLIYEITTRDDKTEKHECVDFAERSSDFLTLYKPNFLREMIRLETILRVKYYFKP
jgi:hypothetical protein